jgi:hypothetical protein
VIGVGREGRKSNSEAHHSHTCPAPSWPAHLLRNVPLQPLRRRQHRVWLAQAVPSLCVAQVKGVSAQDKLKGESQAEKQASLSMPALQVPSSVLLPPRGAQ